MSAFAVTASPKQAFIDALKSKLEADTVLMGTVASGGLGVTGIFGHVSETVRKAYPYVVFGYEHEDDEGAAGAMGLAGSRVEVTLDIYSAHKGKSEARAIGSRIYAICERQPLRVKGFALMVGSVHREFEDIDDEPDEDAPSKRLYHGVQRWGAVLDEAA